jgi:hypothetical protein
MGFLLLVLICGSKLQIILYPLGWVKISDYMQLKTSTIHHHLPIILTAGKDFFIVTTRAIAVRILLEAHLAPAMISSTLRLDRSEA